METINRNNYEEHFLLYVDGELDAESQLAVENFIQQHADLAVELEMLMNSRLSPETIAFSDKAALLRTEGDSIHETNHEEYFLLYIDNELSAAKREEVEMYVLKHPELQDEFMTLKQAVLAPEAISYGDKTDLYRAEKRRTFYIKQWYAAAAAIFIGICAMGVWLMQPSNKATAPVAINQPAKGQLPEIGEEIKTPAAIQQPIQQAEQPVIAAQPLPGKENKNLTNGTKRSAQDITRQSLHGNAGNEQEPVIAGHPVINHNNIVTRQKEPAIELHEIVDVPEPASQIQTDVAMLQAPETETNNSHTVYPVAYKELNINDDDRSLHVGMFDLNKDKVKTLFKKAGRAFGNRSNDFASEDGKLQVANFEIETKKQ